MMFMFPCRSIAMYRLCLIFFVAIISSCVTIVLSSKSELSDSKSTEYVNLNLGKPLTISLSKYYQNNKKNTSVLLTDEVIENMDVLLPMQTVPLEITDIPSTVYFIITEIHTFSHNVTLGYQKNKLDPHSYITGKNIGLVNMTSDELVSNVTLYLENNSDCNVTVLIAVTVHNKSVPIPGGCNMEFQTEIAPYLMLSYTDSVITILNQPAAMPPTFIKKKKSCQIPPGTLLHYETYHMYLPEGDFTEETYFHAIRSMISVQRIHQNGKKIPASLFGRLNKRLFSAYLGTGSVFGIVVYTLSSVGEKNYVSLTSAAYVPILTYACSPEAADNNCEIFKSELTPWLFIGIFIFGFFLTMCGHVYFKTQMFIYGALTSGIIGHILLIIFLDLTPAAITSLSALSLLLGGLLWLKVWTWFGVPIVSILLPLFNAGVLASALLFYCFSNSDEVQPIIQSDANFWMALFTTSLMFVTLLLVIAEAHNASIFTSAFFGAFMMIMTLDYVVGSNLKYTVVNLYRRVTIPEFNEAVIDPPIQNPDIVLLLMWIALTITGCCTQLVFSAGKPPFPPPNNRRTSDRYIQRVIPNAIPVEIDSGNNSHSNGEIDERSPLLSNPNN